MKLNSLQPFVPSGPDMELSKKLFIEMGFEIRWDAGDYTSFHKDGFGFILQKNNDKTFAENFMISVGIDNVDAYREELRSKELEQKFGIKIGNAVNQPYGREVNIIDIAGVCWHFVQ